MLWNESLVIRGMKLKNRIVMPPMATRMADQDGGINDAMLDYYGKRASGGKLSLIIIEHSCVNIQGKTRKTMISLANDADIEGHRRLAGRIHEHGVPVIAQINHCGSLSDPEATGLPVIAPSPVVHPRCETGLVPMEMTKEDIDRLVDDFAAAAARALMAGYDGVEIHSAHGYLLNQFYSPLTNKRSDEYGCGSMEDRLRVHFRVLEAVRAAVGDKPMFLRLGGCDYLPGGTTIDDTAAAAPLLESAGADVLDITGGMNGYIIPGRTEPGYFRDITDTLKGRIGIPVILTGGVKHASEAEKLLESGTAQLIGVGRAIFADPDWADKNL